MNVRGASEGSQRGRCTSDARRKGYEGRWESEETRRVGRASKVSQMGRGTLEERQSKGSHGERGSSEERQNGVGRESRRDAAKRADVASRRVHQLEATVLPKSSRRS